MDTKIEFALVRVESFHGSLMHSLRWEFYEFCALINIFSIIFNSIGILATIFCEIVLLVPGISTIYTLMITLSFADSGIPKAKGWKFSPFPKRGWGMTRSWLYRNVVKRQLAFILRELSGRSAFSQRVAWCKNREGKFSK